MENRKKVRRKLAAGWLCAALFVTAAVPADAWGAAAETQDAAAQESTAAIEAAAVSETAETSAVSAASWPEENQGTWILRKGKHYWKYADGTIREKAGAFSAKGNTWCTYRDGSRVESAYRKIKGKYYYFKANGKLYQPKKAQFRRLGGKTCYFYTDGHVAVGRTKIGSKYYYFDAKGALQTDQQAVQVNGQYYSTDAKGGNDKDIRGEGQMPYGGLELHQQSFQQQPDQSAAAAFLL